MKQRRSKRISIGFKVDLISENGTHCGEISNLSEDGACIVIFPTEPDAFEPGKEYELIFHLFAEETITSRARVKWSKKTPSHELTSQVGLEILDPSWEKSSFFV